MNEPVGELGNQRNEEQRNKAVRTAQQMVDDGLRWVMGDARGRAFVWSLLEEARMFHPVFHANPQIMAVNEGKRQAGLSLLNSVMRTAPQQYAVMTQEAAARARTPKQQEQKNGDRADADTRTDA